MARFLEPLPRDVPAGPGGWFVRSWVRWLSLLRDSVNEAPQRVAPALALTGQTAAIAADLPLPSLSAGYYRVSAFAVGVAVTVAIGFVLDGASRSVSLGSAADPFSGAAFVEVDAGSAIGYTVTPSAAGSYDVVIVVERVEA